jgi:hypothetical protein
MTEEEIYILEETPYYSDTRIIGYTTNLAVAKFWVNQASNATASTRWYSTIKNKTEEIITDIEMSEIKYDEEKES